MVRLKWTSETKHIIPLANDMFENVSSSLTHIEEYMSSIFATGAKLCHGNSTVWLFVRRSRISVQVGRLIFYLKSQKLSFTNKTFETFLLANLLLEIKKINK
jgi:hypothetical protein